MLSKMFKKWRGSYMEMEGFSEMEGWLMMQYYMYYLLGTTAYFLAHVMHTSLGKLKQLRRGLRSLCSLP